LAENRAERRLAAILAADVAGYSRLMGVDEEGTLAALKDLRRSLIDAKIAEHRGRIVRTTGDGALVEFSSAVDAVRCALQIQRTMAERNAEIPEDRRIEFRMGINVGDIILDEGDIFGDGVNIAARIEALANPGAICLSDDAYRQIKGKVALDVSDMGERQLKNISLPVRVFSVRQHSATARPVLALPDKPSIAVLPFQNMSGDPEQEYFADGMAEEILTALSRCKWLFVIARTSSFTYKSKGVDVRQVGRELGVRYVLEGSVRRGGNYLRFTAQLIDATSGTQIWADRFEGERGDVFSLQDRITESVVGAIEPNLQRAEIERLKQKPSANLDAYDLLLRAHQLVYEFTADSLSAALEYLKRSLAIDPHYAPAMAMTAYCYYLRRYQSWAKDIEAEAAMAIKLSLRAVELASDDANVLWMAGTAIWPLPGELRRGTDWVRRSLEINPNSAMALTVMGWIESFSGDNQKALLLLTQARRLSPRDPSAWFTFCGLAIVYFRLERYEESVAAAETALSHNPRYGFALRYLAAGLVMLERRERAKEVARLILKIEPGVTLAQIRARRPDNVDLQFADVYLDALGVAGIPE
jgi:adenylate cyclase